MRTSRPVAARSQAGSAEGVAIRRSLAPYGVCDLLVQIGLWVVFGLAYEAVRGAVVHDRVRAFGDSKTIIDLERRTHTFFELALQHDLPSGHAIAQAFRLTYWISEFVLLVLALVYTYFRRRETYPLFRDAVLLTNSLGLLGYLSLPTAPPRLLTGYGFRNDLSGQPTPDHATGLIAFAANPYAAMPSLHVADAILIGLFLASQSRSLPIKALWLLWPCWLSYVVIASGNHFWLDVAAGAALAAISLLISSQLRRRRARVAHASVTSHEPPQQANSVSIR
jgi:membrane-associated phospholipid phosphatase